ncbi:unnamed protein product [marine sediment metagenome]|uniref:Uncharacterized protein n=1 Tax=marine sediment metagenome TaxID=412755 RepID=X0VT20_9ZZZZ
MIPVKTHPPKHYPNCGSTDINSVVGKNNQGSAIHDTCCENCMWSGDISPDSDLRIKEWMDQVQSSGGKANDTE